MTTVHTRLDDEARDRAALYALDCLPGDELWAYEAHVAACAVCAAEVDSLRPAVAALGALVDPLEPDPALRLRLERQVAGTGDGPVQTWKGWTPDRPGAPLVLVQTSDTDWEQTGVAGVAVRRLFVDPGGARATMLVRMEPGASYPPHRHGGVEECYVLQGDLQVGGQRMSAGDYQRADLGSHHERQATVGGCLLFIVSSLSDEIVGGAPPA